MTSISEKRRQRDVLQEVAARDAARARGELVQFRPRIGGRVIEMRREDAEHAARHRAGELVEAPLAPKTAEQRPEPGGQARLPWTLERPSDSPPRVLLVRSRVGRLAGQDVEMSLVAAQHAIANGVAERIPGVHYPSGFPEDRAARSEPDPAA